MALTFGGGGGRSAAFAVIGIVVLLIVLLLAYRFVLSPGGGGSCADPLPMTDNIHCRVSSSTGDDVYSGRGGAVPVDENGSYYSGTTFSDYGGAGKGASKNTGGPYGRGGGFALNESECRAKCTSTVTNHNATETGCVSYTWNPDLTQNSSYQNCFLWTHPPSGMKGLDGWKSAVI